IRPSGEHDGRIRGRAHPPNPLPLLAGSQKRRFGDPAPPGRPPPRRRERRNRHQRDDPPDRRLGESPALLLPPPPPSGHPNHRQPVGSVRPAPRNDSGDREGVRTARLVTSLPALK